MRSSRWCVGFAAAVGLVGSVVMGPSVSSAAPAVEDGARRAGAFGQVGSGVPAPGPVGLPVQRGDEDGDHGPRACKGLVPYPIPEEFRPYYFCGDWRLGPKRLPTRGLLGNILEGYDRLGGLTAVEFLNRWWDPSLDSGEGDWKYPNDDGFEHDSMGGVLAAPLLLQAGQNLMVDRFGNESGRFFSPAGTKYGQRAIPPSSLNTIDPRYPYDYNLYRVAKDVTVCAGPAAPAFEQPGGAIQYVASSRFCPSIPFATVATLVNNGTLVRVKTTPVDEDEAQMERESAPVAGKATSR